MKVYSFLYNPMLEVSSYCTISLHKTRKSAEKALDNYKLKCLDDWNLLYPDKKDEPYEFGTFEDWVIKEIDVLD